ncbi:infB [Symbiodinium sp. CCMP2592]|nr:infB [Symbiodinium sp. CCMP2592]
MAGNTLDENPNLHDQHGGDVDFQVMSSPNVTAVAGEETGGQIPVVNGVRPVLRGGLDLDDEVRGVPTVFGPGTNQPGFGDWPGPVMEGQRATRSPDVATGPLQPREGQVGVGSGTSVSVGRPLDVPADVAPAPSNVFSGMMRAVQALPTTVESFVKSTSGIGVGYQPELRDSVEYASVTSSGGGPKGGRAPSESQVPTTPLLDQEMLMRMEHLQARAPLIYPSDSPTPPPPHPPSVSSSDVQAEVRRQLIELMALRDEEGRRLRAQVEALVIENSELRTRAFDNVQGRSMISRTESVAQGFAGLGWISRGIGNLMGSGRALDLRPQGSPAHGLDLTTPSQAPLDLGRSQPPMPPMAVQPQGQVMPPGAAQPQGQVMPPGAAQPQGQVMPPGAAQPQGQVMPLGAAQPQGQVMPPGAAQPQGQVMPLGAAQPQGQVMPPGAAQPQGQVMPPGAVQPQGQVMPLGAAQPQGQVMPPGAAQPQGQVMPPGAVQPQGQVMPLGAAQPQGQVMPPGAAQPQGQVMPPGAVQPQGQVMPLGAAQPQGQVMPPGAAQPQGQVMPQVQLSHKVLPPLPELSADSCLAFADWLHNVRPALADVSDNSEELWSMVVSEATTWYGTYLKLDPMSRIASKAAPCTFYVQANGCKKGKDCAFEHNWAAFSAAEKGASSTVQGTPVTLASLSAQLETLRNLAQEHDVRAVAVASDEIATSQALQHQGLNARMHECERKVAMFQVDSDTDERLIKALALLDSGATHAVVPYEQSMGQLDTVPVTLAGDSRQNWMRTAGGTLVVPPPSQGRGWDLTKGNAVWRVLLWAAVLWSLASVARGSAVPYVREVPIEDWKDYQTFLGWCLLSNLDLGFLGQLDVSEEGATGKFDPGASCEVLDSIIRSASCAELLAKEQQNLDDLEEERLNAMFEQESVISSSEEESENADYDEEAKEGSPESKSAEVKEFKEVSEADLEGWKRHLLSGHVPYRRDCKQCVEGAALGAFHSKIKHPRMYTLSIDLFGPVPVDEAGRDETCVTGKCSLRYGLVGAFRLPRSVIEDSLKPGNAKESPMQQDGTGQVPDEVRYEECKPSEVEPELFPELFEGDLDVPALSAIEAEGVATSLFETTSDVPDDPVRNSPPSGGPLRGDGYAQGAEKVTMTYSLSTSVTEFDARPDPPNLTSLTTGEVQLIDRLQRKIPWIFQNRTLGVHSPGPPVPGLGVRGEERIEEGDWIVSEERRRNEQRWIEYCDRPNEPGPLQPFALELPEAATSSSHLRRASEDDLPQPGINCASNEEESTSNAHFIEPPQEWRPSTYEDYAEYCVEMQDLWNQFECGSSEHTSSQEERARGVISSAPESSEDDTSSNYRCMMVSTPDDGVEAEVGALEGMKGIKRLKGTEALRAAANPDALILPAKTVFTVKPGSDGSLFRRKCRVVGCGNFEDKDPSLDLYASGVPSEVLRTILIECAVREFHAFITDIKNAFLLAPLPQGMHGKILLRPPKVLESMGITEPNELWEVCKAVYGLRQSPRWWAEYRDSVLRNASWEGATGPTRLCQSAVEGNVWKILNEGDELVGYALVYVDDIMFLTTSEEARLAHSWLRSVWQCTPLENTTEGAHVTFLGVEISYGNDSQGNSGEWVRDLPEEESDYDADTLRRAQKITGELLWLTQRTRVDLAFAVSLMGPKRIVVYSDASFSPYGCEAVVLAQSTEAMIADLATDLGVKHLRVRSNFVKEMVDNKDLEVRGT